MASSFFSQATAHAKKGFGGVTKQAQNALNKVSHGVSQVGQYVNQQAGRSIYDGNDEDEASMQLSGHFLLEVVRASNLPKTGLLDGKGTVVSWRVCSAAGALRGVRCRTLPRRGTDAPAFHTMRDAKVDPQPGDILLLEVAEVGSSKPLHGLLSVDALLAAPGTELTLPLHSGLAPVRVGGQVPTLTVRHAPWVHPPPMKTVFFIRHGESKWNEAQQDLNLKNMLAFDHPLNQEGVQQSEQLRQRWSAAAVSCGVTAELGLDSPFFVASPSRHAAKGSEQPLVDFSSLAVNRSASANAADPFAPVVDPFAPAAARPPPAATPSSPPASSSQHENDVRNFVRAECVYASPLTRALQTALIALHGHPTLGTPGLTLLQSAREIKFTLGGLDSVGKEVGTAIKRRAYDTMCKDVGQAVADRYVAGAALELQDVQSDWWTSEREFDAEADLAERFEDFLATLLFQRPACKSAVVVGHSLFFLEFFKRYLSVEVLSSQPGLASDLQEYKLANAACVAVDLRYHAYRTEVVGARLMFGGGFKKEASQ